MLRYKVNIIFSFLIRSRLIPVCPLESEVVLRTKNRILLLVIIPAHVTSINVTKILLQKKKNSLLAICIYITLNTAAVSVYTKFVTPKKNFRIRLQRNHCCIKEK